MNNKGKLKKLIKRREAIIQRIEKDEKKFEEVRLLMEQAKQKNHEKLNSVTQEILGCIDNDAVQAFVSQFTDDFVNDSKTKETSQIDNNQEIEASLDNNNQIEDNFVEVDFVQEQKDLQQSDDDYAENFRKQYGL